MIGWIQGVLKEKHPPQLLLDVHGVGYELAAPMTTFYDLPEPGKEVALHTHQIVREDAHQLYGFFSRHERDVFRMLLRVNGVGAKLGLAILSGMDAQALTRCIYEGDTASLAKLPGIGKKTAERLVIDMRDRLDAPSSPSLSHASPAGPGPVTSDPAGEAISALVALGFKPQEASRQVHGIEPDGLACEEIVRQALKSLAK